MPRVGQRRPVASSSTYRSANAYWPAWSEPAVRTLTVRFDGSPTWDTSANLHVRSRCWTTTAFAAALPRTCDLRSVTSGSGWGGNVCRTTHRNRAERHTIKPAGYVGSFSERRHG